VRKGNSARLAARSSNERTCLSKCVYGSGADCEAKKASLRKKDGATSRGEYLLLGICAQNQGGHARRRCLTGEVEADETLLGSTKPQRARPYVTKDRQDAGFGDDRAWRSTNGLGPVKADKWRYSARASKSTLAPKRTRSKPMSSLVRDLLQRHFDCHTRTIKPQPALRYR